NRRFSQHALAVVVQAYEGMESVLLPYHYSGMFPEVPFSLVWRCSDLNQTVLHLLKYERGNLKEQYSYSERTSMKTNAPQSGDFSLTLKKPQLSDSNNYTCNLQWENEWKETKEDRLTQVELQVKGQTQTTPTAVDTGQRSHVHLSLYSTLFNTLSFSITYQY
uniref:Immunoglobulin V-set domain-containing protein n=1 Tax=Sphaeramia orbicularis TaxID=375764 RepID=A0A673CFF2_9TELE